jgi:hypothetical protein
MQQPPHDGLSFNSHTPDMPTPRAVGAFLVVKCERCRSTFQHEVWNSRRVWTHARNACCPQCLTIDDAAGAWLKLHGFMRLVR